MEGERLIQSLSTAKRGFRRPAVTGDGPLDTATPSPSAYPAHASGSPRGEAKKLTMPDGAVEEWSFNGTGQTTAYTSPLNYVINYVYDDAGKQTTVDYPTGTDTALGYDNAGRRTSMLDSTGTSTWTLDAASQVTQLVTPQGTQNYTYNDAGQRATMVESGLGTTHTVYDTAGRYSTTINRHGESSLLAYDTLGRAYRKFLQNGLYEEYLYDSSSRLTSVGVWNPSTGTNVRMETYTYNLANQMTSKTVGGVTTSYTYDLAGQLASESRPGYSCSYTYDANGNRLSKTLNGVTETYTYDDGDKMLTAGSKSYGYDAAGRTTSVTNGPAVTNLSYDWESRLTSLSGAQTASYAYNGLDTRVSKIENSVTTNYVRDGIGVTSPVIRDSFASYTPGTSERRGSVSTFSHSGMKNAETQTDTAKAVSATKQYDAFGNAVATTGTWQGAFGYAGNFGYQEDASGLKLLGHRYYDSSTGRFLTRDPVKDGRNWYVYCGCDPVQGVDPSGLLTVFGFEFTEETVGGGLSTGLAGAANGLSFGLVGAGGHENDIGFGVSQGLGRVGGAAGIAATTVAALPAATLIIVPEGTVPAVIGTGAAIGNGSNARVIPFAQKVGVDFFQPTWPGGVGGWIQNLGWMLQKIFTRDSIYDIGPWPGKDPSGPWYKMERFLTRFLCE